MSYYTPSFGIWPKKQLTGQRKTYRPTYGSEGIAVAKKGQRHKAWAFVEASPNVHVLRTGIDAGDELWTLWLSDLHWDNPKCDRDLLKKHLDEALEWEAPIFVIGDLFCAMQGKFDRRSSKADIRPEHMGINYFDRLVDTACEYFEPYKENLCLLGYGNHETAVKFKLETDILDSLARRLRGVGGITRTGGYGGFVRIQNQAGNTRTRESLRIYYHHGYGGGGRASKGMNQFQHYIQDARADCFVAGHVHHSGHYRHVQSVLTDSNKLLDREVDFVRLGTYKDDWGGGKSGWAVEKNLGPRPKGGWWMRLKFFNHRLHKQWIATASV